MNLTLFEIDNTFLNIVNEIETAEGEVSPELAASYDNILTDIVKKETGYLSIQFQLDSQIEKGKEIIKRLQAKIKSFENHQAQLKNRLIEHMILTGKDTIETNLGKIRLQISESVIDLPISEIDPQYIKTEIIQKIDKTQIKKDAKLNPDIKQKYIIKNHYIKIY